ncbi:phosphotransferase family protein [Sulfitobacter sp. M57]|uniref:choline/ethanolamine kinase family protein n=1 Tax=unclassified Sulfitobacter TaxID=196795 RepID=UPI0023E0B4E8|nr:MULTISPECIES: choline/ethanolamine kinase family protein [unclassified Sulfitobacter]MDF3415485.1 phosphotransferase family protein [Sulfitobacter sp. KE5]MDF3422966.1 phosphotransferase family protein [Sulfitobacter sp. KE43]MDF3434031.1 phosphotransferase family protein [Sulfitobacter sp. KE42]MDF3459936.1 phosphotransferase family protein [Sulfitobacter sp. S74]MDF3463570.1 phosphotransferase family protein [Sulfitobacter sp. Ks18]
MSKHAKTVLQALRKAPQFAEVENPDSITRLGGLTNLVHRVDMGDTSVIVRIAGDGTEEYIDRTVEVHNAEAAARAGVSPRVIFAEPASGLMISETVPDVETMSPELFATRGGSPARAGIALAKLHTSGETFQFRFELFAMIDDYLNILSTKDVELPEGYDGVVAAANPIKQVLESANITLAPCHCDPLCENFLDDGTVMWIVDWEYSGMNDPLWDVGDLSVEAGMNARQDSELMTAYFGRPATAAETGRMVIYKAMCDLLWTLWGLIQHADGNPAEDFWAYATGRFERCKALMQDPAFQAHVDAVRAG